MESNIIIIYFQVQKKSLNIEGNVNLMVNVYLEFLKKENIKILDYSTYCTS